MKKPSELLGCACDPAFWARVRTDAHYDSYRAELHQLWEKFGIGEIPELTPEAYALFRRTGDRLTYERPYFARRLGMDTAALLALIYPDEPGYLARLHAYAAAICAEPTWCVPAHSADTDMQHARTRLDLFAAETGFALAEITALLGERMDASLRQEIQSNIDARIVAGLRDRSGWESVTNNWASVCAASVGCMLMLMRPELFETYRPRLTQAFTNYLSGFEPDGICAEGFGYWHYGFGFFTVYADMLQKWDGTDLFSDPKVHAVACGVQNLILGHGGIVSFSDGPRHSTYHRGLFHALSRRYPDDFRIPTDMDFYNYDTCGRFCLHLRGATWLRADLPQCDAIFRESIRYAPDTQWVLARMQHYAFAAKGGHNAEPHNHNDVGSFILAIDGTQILTDLGSGLYTRQYFSAERYQTFCASSLGHSVPIISGQGQKPGQNFSATRANAHGTDFSLDISRAYDVPALRALVRNFHLRPDGVTLTDTYELTDPVDIVERLITLIPPEASMPGQIRLENVCVLYPPDQVTYQCTQHAHTRNVRQQPVTETVYALDFLLRPGIRQVTFQVNRCK